MSACKPDKYFGLKYSPTSSIALPTQKTMIVNTEQNNEIEGHYLKVLEVINDSTYRINLPHNFYLINKNIGTWAIGWPTDSAYYAAGNENLARIKHIDVKKGIVVMGTLLRGSGLPKPNNRIVFWSLAPSGYSNVNGKLIDPRWFEGFAGESIEFGSIIYDKISRQWLMYIQEVDTEHVQIYVAASPNLYTWGPANNGKPLFTAKNFIDNTTWAGHNYNGSVEQSARLYSAILHQGKWTFFLSGCGKNGKRQIGTITSTNPLTGPFDISKEPIISNGIANSPDERACFYPKVAKANGKYVMYYDGVDWNNTETVCMAESKDLRTWHKYKHNPVINQHYGWRSGTYTSEPNVVLYSNDTLWLMCGGYKKYNTEFGEDDERNGRAPLDASIFSKAENGKYISGNVMDAQLGAFFSTDGGYTFTPNTNNPVWINNYTDTLQNDHIGGDYFNTIVGGKSVIIYQAKSGSMNRYNILMRSR